MSRYIDADMLTRRWCGIKCGCKREECGREIEPCIVVAMIEEAPSIDIVRCKECVNWDTTDGECYADKGGLYFPKADDFCSYGERKSDE